MLKSKIYGRDPATSLDYANRYKRTCERENRLVGIANFGPYPLFFRSHFRVATKIGGFFLVKRLFIPLGIF